MALLVRACAFIILILLAACQRDGTVIEVDESSVSVHSVLVAGSDSAFVLVSRIQSALNEWGETTIVPAPDAIVRLIHPGGIATLTYGRKCASIEPGRTFHNPHLTGECYAGSIPGSLRAGETYQLEVSVTGQFVYGSVQVPAPAPILSPLGSPEVHTTGPDTPALVAQWVASSNPVVLQIVPNQTGCYAAFAMPGDGSSQFSGRLWVTLTGENQATIFLHAVQCNGPVAEVQPARLIVSTYDPGYALINKSLRDRGLPIEEASVGLVGAFGYFGAVANSSVPITLIP